MIWKAKEVHNLKNGDTKTVSHFAWLPKRVGNNIVWLGEYEYLYAWIITTRLILIDDKTVEFKYGDWEKISERVINESD